MQSLQRSVSREPSAVATVTPPDAGTPVADARDVLVTGGGRTPS
ncbi:hypothetical protein [Terracoccus luteus]|uniref:Uncharacterized protein n=1 Tax=Terracoccus luteus TaxID=53356 RepID=A0A839PY21_9MICO|nr:hypothetical protein [Terracoccus luteus]MBB2985301.1 hypothetical protein [Terracoccus luteus]MCP2170953.1 hypothetical protein [Terracoccus luteus]